MESSAKSTVTRPKPMTSLNGMDGGRMLASELPSVVSARYIKFAPSIFKLAIIAKVARTANAQ